MLLDVALRASMGGLELVRVEGDGGGGMAVEVGLLTSPHSTSGGVDTEQRVGSDAEANGSRHAFHRQSPGCGAEFD